MSKRLDIWLGKLKITIFVAENRIVRNSKDSEAGVGKLKEKECHPNNY